jgi:hypothetical protein
MVWTWYILLGELVTAFLFSVLSCGLICCYDRLSLVLRYMRERFANCVHLRNVICDFVSTPPCFVVIM